MTKHFLLALLALIGASAAFIHQKKTESGPMPPQSNPNVDNDFDGKIRKPWDQIAALERPTEDAGLSDATCNLAGIISASGNTLVDLVKSATSDCVNKLFDVVGSDASYACNEADMNSIGNAFYAATSSYDPTRPENTKELLPVTMYLRACYFVQTNQPQTIGNYSSNLLNLVKYGLDNFFNRPNLESTKADHYVIARQIISLISNAFYGAPEKEYFTYVDRLSKLFTKLTYGYNFQSSVFVLSYDQADVIYAIYDIFSRTHNKEGAKEYYCQHNEVPWSLNVFMDWHGDLVGTKNEWILRNTGGEMARFLKYDCLYSQVSGYVKSQLSKHSTSAGEKVWAVMANSVDQNDKKNCASYGVCDFKVNLEKKILPITRTCPKTYVDTFIVRAQAMSSTELDEVCTRLKAQETHFHNLVKDNWTPVVPDTNDKIEVVIFDNTEQYKFYAWLLFDIDTDNGGMYIEGDPSQPGNVARYYCFERPLRGGKFNVWNLEHEFNHYLDGRYNMKGNFYDTNKPMSVWWGEGFAEYAANKEDYPSMVDDCKRKQYTLSTIFNNDYSSGTTRVYHYGYLAARFMFERHRSEVDTILNFFRAGKQAEYQSWMNGIVNLYDNEFSSWCTCIANGKPCP